eukprot:6051198-Pyramimonas_sp.AAC.1
MHGVLLRSLNCSSALPPWALRVRRFCARISCCINVLGCSRVRRSLFGLWCRCAMRRRKRAAPLSGRRSPRGAPALLAAAVMRTCWVCSYRNCGSVGSSPGFSRRLWSW